jgi:tripartite-type tricarboxylate transporter receptor subunit TctC
MALQHRYACVTAAFTLFSLALAPAAGFAQSFPAQPVRIVVGDAAGGVTDLAARIVAPRLADALGQPVIVDNRPGGTGAIAAVFVAKAAADGYTLFLGNNGSLVMNPVLQPGLLYEPTRDFTPVVAVSSIPYALVAHPSTATKDLKELLALARAQPGKIAYATPGNGTIGQLLGDWIKHQAGVDLSHVPFKGGAAATTAVVGGHVPVALLAVSSVTQHVRAGRLRMLGVSSAQRLSFEPDWPTLSEAGASGVNASVWLALLAPAATPPAVVTRLNTEVNRVLRLPEVRDALSAQGAVALGGAPDALSAMIKTESGSFTRMAREFNIRLD